MVERAAVLLERRALPRAGLGPLIGLAGQLLLLTGLEQSVGLGSAGWLVGIASGVILDVTLARALWRDPVARLGPADWVTLTRATFAVGVAALTVDSLVGSTSTS